MFVKATHSLLRQTDQDGTLIAVSRLNDSEKLKPLAVVIKYPRTWFWQRTKYKPTDFTLNDLLEGTPIQPVLEEKVFLNKYEETRNGGVAGSGEVDMPGVSMKAEGRGTSKILSSLGTLIKESVIMPHFLKESKDRKVDPQHNLITQIQGKNQVFTLVKQRIFTTRDCTINFSEQNEGKCSALLTLIPTAKVILKESISLQNSRDVAIEIPPHTVMAYSVSELLIKSDGQYDIGVSPDGIEADDDITQHSIYNGTEVDGLWARTQITAGSSLSVLNKELKSVTETLCALSCLSPETRLSLLNLFQEMLPDQTLLSTLVENLDKIFDGSMSDSHTYLSDTSNELTDKFLDVLQSETDCMDSMDRLSTVVLRPNAISNQNGSQSAPASWNAANSNHNGLSEKSANQRQLILTAMHMLISAAEEMTIDGLTALKNFSSETINWLHYLVTLLSRPQQVPFNELPQFLRNSEVPQDVEQLFISFNITLKRDSNKMYAEIGNGSKVLPLVLCIVIHGLAYLNESCETDIEI